MRPLLAWLVWWAAAACASAAAPPDATAHAIRRGLDRLQVGAASYAEKRQCFSCHHQALTVAALAGAKRRGFAVDEALLKDQVRFTLASFTPKLAQVRKGQSVPGGNTMAAYALFALRQADHPRDDTTSALVEYLLVRQHADGSWPALMPRPPSEGSKFTNTALALQALAHYGSGDTPSRRRVDLAFAKGKAWLTTHEPATTEDRVFHLRGLVALKEDATKARRALERGQLPDGSWAQLPELPGDAYATAGVLLALRAAGVPEGDPGYRMGIAYLLQTQNADGSWIVATRSRPVQTFFDNGDPGGKSQFISFAATGWATWALIDSVPARPLRRPGKSSRRSAVRQAFLPDFEAGQARMPDVHVCRGNTLPTESTPTPRNE